MCNAACIAAAIEQDIAHLSPAGHEHAHFGLAIASDQDKRRPGCACVNWQRRPKRF